MKSYNIELVYKGLDDNIDGYFNISPQDGACLIVINSNINDLRQKFVLAKEFGHFISYKFQGKSGGRIHYNNGSYKIIST